jgi:aryl-alcohol dehydrogenase-like predicted oxidoreductase
VIGAWLKASGKRDAVQIATKVGMLPGEGGEKLAPARIAAAADASLKRLGVERIDLYFAHQDDDAVRQEDALAAFGKLIDAGKVRALGASNFHAARLKSANEAATAGGLPHYRVLQPEYNLVSRHKFEGELQDYCVEHNIGVVPYYGLASGFLTGKYRSTADLGKSVRGGRMTEFLEGTGLAVLAALDEVAADTGATLAQIALAWLAAQPGVTAPIASATSVAQIDELTGSMNIELSESQLDRLTNAGA